LELVHKLQEAVTFLVSLRVETDHRTAKSLLELVQAILGGPFYGIGKPEPLKYLAPNVWSRRITQEHRCVYLIKSDRVEFLQGRNHYRYRPRAKQKAHKAGTVWA
jgi:toxin YoeB